MFQGVYNDKQKHEPDFDQVLERASANGVERIIGKLVPFHPLVGRILW